MARKRYHQNGKVLTEIKGIRKDLSHHEHSDDKYMRELAKHEKEEGKEMKMRGGKGYKSALREQDTSPNPDIPRKGPKVPGSFARPGNDFSKRPHGFHQGGRVFENLGDYGDMDDRRKQEHRDAMMISEDPHAVANLPQQVVMREWPRRPYMHLSALDDTIRVIDRQMEDDTSEGKNYEYPEKY